MREILVKAYRSTWTFVKGAKCMPAATGFDLPTLLLQMGTILGSAWFFGWLFRALHQPRVVGEMVAGIALGPSLLGWVAPSVSATLFPAASFEFLNVLSQVGLIVFMFLVGLEFDPRSLHGHAYAAPVISVVSIAVPFCLGSVLAVFLYPRVADASVPLPNFALFMGTAISITAFPVLARILTEHRLSTTSVGTITLTCAASDDVAAWCILAGVVAWTRTATFGSALWFTLFGLAAYVAIMLGAVRRIVPLFEHQYRRQGALSQHLLAVVLLLVIASSLITEWLGVHAFFGAFLAGVIMPKEPAFRHALDTQLKGLTTVLLLPLFFALTGLRTSIGGVDSAAMWLYCVLIIVVATIGKFGGAALAARATGLPWRDAAALGILMNTRGLIELIVLNIGLDLGMIPPTVFTMMVLMALFTTVITTPLLRVVYPTHARVQRSMVVPIGGGVPK